MLSGWLARYVTQCRLEDLEKFMLTKVYRTINVSWSIRKKAKYHDFVFVDQQTLS